MTLLLLSAYERDLRTSGPLPQVGGEEIRELIFLLTAIAHFRDQRAEILLAG